MSFRGYFLWDGEVFFILVVLLLKYQTFENELGKIYFEFQLKSGGVDSDI